jgi:predicted helicase
VQVSIAPQGLLTPNLNLLDPATGTGTFLLATLEAGLARAATVMGEPAVPAQASGLAGRLHGFEMLVVPYLVTHYRLTRLLAGHGAEPAGRLPVYLSDTLAPPGGAIGLTPRLGFLSQPVRDERDAADVMKRQTEVLAILGNPPYRRLEAGEEPELTQGWDGGFWEDLKAPVRAAGWGNELNTFPDLYIAFWRWCLWKMFDAQAAPGRGVVCLITNSKFLSGHTYAGLRLMLRRRFDRITVLDLRGEGRGARRADIAADENIFDILAGVCITVAVADGEKSGLAEAALRYADVWRHGAFTRAEKLA